MGQDAQQKKLSFISIKRLRLYEKIKLKFEISVDTGCSEKKILSSYCS